MEPSVETDTPTFAERVYTVVRRVPRGRVITYGGVARMIGAPRSARYVGFVLHANPNPGTEPGCTPCHRVVFADGRLAPGFAFGGPDEQRRLLEAEGVPSTPDGRVDLFRHLWP